MSSRVTKLERDYQAGLIKRIKHEFPGCLVLKNDSGYQQGIPDWSIFYGKHWAMLEIKREPPSPDDFQPNQEWFIAELNKMSFSACVFPENEEEVLDDLRKAFRPRRSARLSQS